MNTQPIQTIVHQRLLNFIVSSLNHTNEKLKGIFSNVLIGTFSHYTLDINKILKKNNLDYFSIFDGKNKFFKSESELINWEIELLNDMMHMKDYNLYNNFGKFQINYIINSIYVFFNHYNL